MLFRRGTFFSHRNFLVWSLLIQVDDVVVVKHTLTYLTTCRSIGVCMQTVCSQRNRVYGKRCTSLQWRVTNITKINKLTIRTHHWVVVSYATHERLCHEIAIESIIQRYYNCNDTRIVLFYLFFSLIRTNFSCHQFWCCSTFRVTGIVLL